MCILFIHVDPEPKRGNYRLIFAANRDESYDRPAAPAKKDEENIIGGKDMEPGKENGTWLSASTKELKNQKKYCIGTLLNVPGVLRQNVCGRGSIVIDYLKSTLDFPDFVTALEKDNIFQGYNLVGVELSTGECRVYHHGNTPIVDSIYSGPHTLVFGNSPSFSPLAKVSAGRFKFQKLIGKELKHDDLVEGLLNLLKDETRHLPDPELESRCPTRFEFLASNFIRSENTRFGTRTHTIILVDYDWNMEFIEHTMKQPIDPTNPEWLVTKIVSDLK